MDLGSIFSATYDTSFFFAVLSIILIDLVLAGDNAVVIAMAVRHLPPERRRTGVLAGAGAAVGLRIVATFFVAQLLTLQLVKLVGGAAILWIAVQLFGDHGGDEEAEGSATTLWQAIRLIVVADLSLSIDNMLAVGGASHGNFFLLLFGLVISVPFVVFTSNVLSRLMARYPAIVFAGAALLGKVGVGMIVTDPAVARVVRVAPWHLYALEALGAVAVLAAGRALTRGRRATAATGAPGLSVTRI